MDRTHQAYQNWHVAKDLVIHAARLLAKDPGSTTAMADLGSALDVERACRKEFERLVSEQGQESVNE